MAKLFKIFRSQKRRSSSKSSSQLVNHKSLGIFRSNTSKDFTEKTETESPVIEAAITYSLSEDEESCEPFLFQDHDIENQLTIDDVPSPEREVRGVSVLRSNDNKTDNFEQQNTEERNEIESSTINSKTEKFLTFTHIEVMRNELAHMMQIANKDKEIFQLQQAAEDMKLQNANALASKDDEIANIKKKILELESSLSLAEDKLAAEVMEHSKTIKVLMETQYDYHQAKGNSWFRSFVCCA